MDYITSGFSAVWSVVGSLTLGQLVAFFVGAIVSPVVMALWTKYTGKKAPMLSEEEVTTAVSIVDRAIAAFKGIVSKFKKQ